MPTSRRPLLRAGFVVLLLISSLWPAAAFVELAEEWQGYPFAARDPNSVSPYGFRHRTATDYVAWTLSHTAITFHGRPFHKWGCTSELDNWGEAANWPKCATRLGFTVDGHASVGSVAHWAKRDAGLPYDRDHLAMVTKVNDGGTIDVEEYDFRSAGNQFMPGVYSRRTGIDGADSYLHVERALPGGIWTSRTTPNGSVGGPALLEIEVKDNNNGGLDYARITISHTPDNEHWSGWQTIYRAEFEGKSKGTARFILFLPPGAVCAKLSFDVFSRNRSADGSQSRQLAPMGYRRYSPPGSTCRPV